MNTLIAIIVSLQVNISFDMSYCDKVRVVAIKHAMTQHKDINEARFFRGVR